MQSNSYFERGWCRFEFDPRLADWAAHSLTAARRAVHAAENAEWLRCGGTWFVGVNALPNNAQGAVGDGPPLDGLAYSFIRNELEFGGLDLDRAQVSICYPGYPQPTASESASAHRYRVERDAAHVDGLLAEGKTRRRHLREHHAFILGIPMVEVSPDASPLVVWEKSHEMVRDAFRNRFDGSSPEQWGEEDITEIYHDVRRRVFASCARVEVAASPGQAYLIHRLSLHGMAPWKGSTSTPADGRMICYFRPEIGGPEKWLLHP